MYENLAWNNFCKTGNLNSFLEYKKMCEVMNIIDEKNRLQQINLEGVVTDELYKDQGYSNKGSSV